MKAAHTLFRRFARALLCAHAFYIAYLPARAAESLLAQGVTGATYRRYAFTNYADGPTHDGFAIVFSGYAGLAWAIAQIALAQFALVIYFAGGYQNRRFAWMTLLTLSTLWFGNLLYFSIIGGFDWYGVPLAIHTVGLAATVLSTPKKQR